MGAVRWTGKAFILLGEVLAADAVEEWVQTKVEDLIISKIKKAASQGASRQTAMEELSNATETFKVALQNSLNGLQEFCVDITDDIKTKQLQKLHIALHGQSEMYVVPRDLISERFEHFITNAFEDAAQLSQFPGLIDTALKKAARDAEQALFDAARKAEYFVVSKKRYVIVAKIDTTTIWKKPELPGHYYFGRGILLAAAPQYGGLDKGIEQLADGIGRMKQQERQVIIEQLY